jgi:hypothetical protein
VSEWSKERAWKARTRQRVVGSNPTHSASNMSFPTNEGGLSIAGVLKWIAIINGVVFLYKGYQGIILRQGATGSGRNVGDPLSGPEAVRWGWENVGYGVVAFLIAWAFWFFWQRNED